MASYQTTSLALALVAISALWSERAVADDFSCQDRIVAPGRSTFEVRDLCGPPDAVDHRVERRTIRRPVSVPCNTPQGVGRCVVFYEDAVEVNLDDWTYDFGSNRLMRFLTFEQGRLVQIQTGGYGHKPS